VLQCVAVSCSVLQCVVVCCNVLQCVAVCCSVLQCVAVCCSELPFTNMFALAKTAKMYDMLLCVAVCCSVLQCVAVSCYSPVDLPAISTEENTAYIKWLRLVGSLKT